MQSTPIGYQRYAPQTFRVITPILFLSMTIIPSSTAYLHFGSLIVNSKIIGSQYENKAKCISGSSPWSIPVTS